MLTDGQLEKEYGITVDELEKLGADGEKYARGEWPNGIVARVGRPRLADEETTAITIRFPNSKIAELEKQAKRLGQTRSSAVRQAVDIWLEAVQ